MVSFGALVNAMEVVYESGVVNVVVLVMAVFGGGVVSIVLVVVGSVGPVVLVVLSLGTVVEVFVVVSAGCSILM